MSVSSLADELLNTFLGDLVTRIGEALELGVRERTTLAKKIPGVIHTHSFTAELPHECAYCRRELWLRGSKRSRK